MFWSMRVFFNTDWSQVLSKISPALNSKWSIEHFNKEHLFWRWLGQLNLKRGAVNINWVQWNNASSYYKELGINWWRINSSLIHPCLNSCSTSGAITHVCNHAGRLVVVKQQLLKHGSESYIDTLTHVCNHASLSSRLLFSFHSKPNATVALSEYSRSLTTLQCSCSKKRIKLI